MTRVPPLGGAEWFTSGPLGPAGCADTAGHTTAGDQDFGASLGNDVNELDGYAGLFSLATAVEAHPPGTLVQVTVSVVNPSQLVLDFSSQQVLTDARVLLCGSIGALVLLDLGYTGPLVRRPRLAADEGARLHGERPARASKA
jgi:hypothetical protein